MESFVATQPIFTAQLNVMGYELLFRNSFDNRFDFFDENEATYQVVMNSCMTFGLDKLVGKHRAFINFTKRHLEEGLAELLPPSQVVIEILESVRPDQEVLALCQQLKSQGYILALDDFVFSPEYLPLLELADIVKVDFLLTKTKGDRDLKCRFPNHKIKLLAEKVETMADFEEAKALGYELFQGYFFHKPTVVSRKALPVQQISYLELLKQLQSDSDNLKKVESIIKRDVSLSYQLLKYMNTPAFGFRQTIQSIQQAVTLLGPHKLFQWVSLMALRQQSSHKPHELVRSASLRARFCENLAIKLELRPLASGAFLMGMFSLLDAMLDIPMESLLEELPLPIEVKSALKGESNLLRKIYEIVLAYENGQWEKCLSFCQASHLAPLTENVLVDCYLEAVEWLRVLEEVEK